jgi:hypothetical protein
MREEITPEQIERSAKLLALEFEKYARGRTWFKPIHISREIRQPESFVKDKLDILVQLNYAKAKSLLGGDLKYCITISSESRIKYLNELLEHLNEQVRETEEDIAALLEEQLSEEK